ncbi:OLC1v1022238C2 [Oldenlandia corymbosa var. corymbosa]|uniref:OLC1v1022238C2 n=1 Tax=Oldenlandia corymbosa var. corymbosa TaxID=529605 RepID=A0AAV1BY35_OLDCO|nr:OLC1v1022238C2 [Oldenlandia corymbosa var. corymbosa]
MFNFEMFLLQSKLEASQMYSAVCLYRIRSNIFLDAQYSLSLLAQTKFRNFLPPTNRSNRPSSSFSRETPEPKTSAVLPKQMEEADENHQNDAVKIELDGGGIGGGVGEDDFQVGTIFPQLKICCLQLLQLHQNPSISTSSSHNSVLFQLLRLLRRSPTHSLQPLFDYVLFPLLLLLDAAVDCRASPENDGKPEVSGVTQSRPHKVSDLVAEGVVACLEELLRKCALGSVDQMVVMLKKLSRAAMLSPLEASEEFREGIIKCFKAVLLRLQPCSDELCSCKQTDRMSELLDRKDSEFLLDNVAKYDSEPKDCLLAFLQSETASVAVGHWLQLLLKAADVEAARGHRGSAALRVEAFITLRLLIAKVGNADALAFFLPGIVSQIGKVLLMSKTMSSGAAGSSEALDQAIKSLAEFLGIVMMDDLNLHSLATFPNDSLQHAGKGKSVVAVLDQLRSLHSKTGHPGEAVVEKTFEIAPKIDSKPEKGMRGSLRVDRSKDWIANTSTHINKLFSTTFPFLVVHPSKKVRLGILSAIRNLLLKCRYTLHDSRLLLLECACVLACDDSEAVSSSAQMFLKCLFSSNRRDVEQDFALIFSRLLEKIPHVVLGNDESVFLSHARMLLVVIYFSGPKFVAAQILHSPVAAARFLDVLSLCFSQNTVFAGSLDRIMVAKPSSAGFVHSIAEMEATRNACPEDIESMVTKQLPNPKKDVTRAYELPGRPPWFGNQQVYQALSAVLRLVGLSLFAASGSKASLSLILDVPLGFMRNLISEIRARECSLESWESWYNRTGSGQLVRQASTAACILNEIIYGLSDQAMGALLRIFRHSSLSGQNFDEYDATLPNQNSWKFSWDRQSRDQLIDCLGIILHEYLSPEVWTLPLGLSESLLQPNLNAEALNLHFFHDNAMLHQVVAEGIGAFTVCLGSDFSSCGFLHSCLFMLLQNLVCSNSKVKTASDAVLRTIASTLDYQTVGHLVIANSDYVIDSICRQLRHLDLNPHMPSVLAAMLSYVGVAHKILPLLEEPMRAVSSELEILGRRQHPDLTIPFLKAVLEISKASEHEACILPSESEVVYEDIKLELLDIEKKREKKTCSSTLDSGEEDAYFDDISREMQRWEPVVLKLKESRRYRRIVGCIAGSCVIAATPILASSQQAACLIAFDVIDEAIAALAGVEGAYRHEKNTREALDQIFDLCSLHSLQDNLAADEDEAGENRLLPAMNKIWPFLIACVRNRNPMAVRRCSQTITNVVQICGGDFFTRRFHTDGTHLWKVLSTSPFQRKPISKEERTSLQLPYRKVSSTFSDADGVAELSTLKVQASVLNMIADIARNKKSSSALETVLKKVSGLVVGIACSGVVGLQGAAVNALLGLKCMDPDLIWLLLADIHFSLKKNDVPSPPSQEFPEISQILPPPLSSKGYLYVEYGGLSYGFDIDASAVEHVFKLLHNA